MKNSVIQPLPSKYKAYIRKIYPHTEKSKLNLDSENSLLGISINSQNATSAKISAIFDFLNSRGLTVINLIIGDYMYWYTAMLKYLGHI